VHRDINGISPDRTMRGPFNIIPLQPGKVPTIPCLWNHDQAKERCLEVKPDTEALLRGKKNVRERGQDMGLLLACALEFGFWI